MKAFLAITLLLLGMAVAGKVESPVYDPVSIDCEEDQACWDCETMGNRICGPLPQ